MYYRHAKMNSLCSLLMLDYLVCIMKTSAVCFCLGLNIIKKSEVYGAQICNFSTKDSDIMSNFTLQYNITKLNSDLFRKHRQTQNVCASIILIVRNGLEINIRSEVQHFNNNNKNIQTKHLLTNLPQSSESG